MRILLDENVSASVARRLAALGHDAYHVRDRGLANAGVGDHVIWRRAVEESRILVTINARDFVSLAGREELHGGLVTFPSGSTSDEQFALTLKAIEFLEGAGGSCLNTWIHVEADGGIQVRDLPPLG